VQAQSSLRLKQLKQVIKEKVESDVNVDQMQLRIEGGEILRKTQITIDDLNLRDGSVVVVDILDKIPGAAKSKKPAKEEPRLPLHYVVKTGEDGAVPVLGKSEVWKNMRVKQLRKVVQEDLGIKDKVTVKLFVDGDEVLDDKLTVEEAQLLAEGAQVDVMVTQKVSIEVQGKGKGYQQEVFVQPSDQVEVLKAKVHFFKTFLQRKHVLIDKKDDKVIDDFSKTFKDYDIKDGA